jgi:hypothetical protein
MEKALFFVWGRNSDPVYSLKYPGSVFNSRMEFASLKIWQQADPDGVFQEVIDRGYNSFVKLLCVSGILSFLSKHVIPMGDGDCTALMSVARF